jgi:hypothetical protein
MMLFLTYLLGSEKSESGLDGSSVSGPTKSEDTSIGYRDGEDSITFGAECFLWTAECCVLVSLGNNRSFRWFKKMKMLLHSPEQVIMIEKRKPELFETDKDYDLLFLKSFA